MPSIEPISARFETKEQNKKISDNNYEKQQIHPKHVIDSMRVNILNP